MGVYILVEIRDTMVLGLILLGAVVGVVAAQEKCCTPDVWEANLRQHGSQDNNGAFRSRYISADLFYDYRGKRFASNVYENYNDGSSSTSRMISLQNEKKAYVIRDGQCETFELTEDMEKICVPEESEFTRTVYLGAGEKKLEMNVFSYEEKEPYGGRKSRSEISVTKEGCIPVTLMRYSGQFGGYRYSLEAEGMDFTNVYPDIKDERVFEPQAECNAPVLPLHKLRPLPESLKKRFHWGLS